MKYTHRYIYIYTHTYTCLIYIYSYIYIYIYVYTHVWYTGISTEEMPWHWSPAPRPWVTWVRRGFQLSQLSGVVSRSVGPVSARRWAMKKLFTLGPQYHGHSQAGTVDEMFQEMIWGHITSLYIYSVYIYISHTHIYIYTQTYIHGPWD